MQPQPNSADASIVIPLCHRCGSPMRIRTIEVQHRHENVRLACTACGSETTQSYRLGN
jgi:hypothetical protein